MKNFVSTCRMKMTILIYSIVWWILYLVSVLYNEFDIYFNNTNSLADISAIIFNTSYKCDNEDYNYNNITDLITMPSDPNDCLNVVLEKYNLCPCPPELKYNKEENIVYIMNTESGNIELNSCV